MKKLYLITIICLSFITTVCAQSSDRCAYYILYDRSGSVKFLDRNHNLINMLNELLQVSAKFDNDSKHMTLPKINSQPPDFNVFFFGGDKKQSLQISYLTAQDKQSTAQILRRMEDTATVSKTQGYTYVHTALLDVIEKIKQDKKAAGSLTAGVFLFTDGQLNTADFKPFDTVKTVTQYYRVINQLIGQVELLTGSPVFLIQTSHFLQNPYYQPLSALFKPDDKPVISESFRKDSTYFWLSSAKKFDETPVDKNLVEAFDNFIDHANELVVSANKPILVNLKGDVGKLMAMQDIVSLKTVISQLKEAPAAKKSLDAILQDRSNAAVNQLLAALKENTDIVKENTNLTDTTKLRAIRKYIQDLSATQLDSVKDQLNHLVAQNIDKINIPIPQISATAFSPAKSNILNDNAKTVVASGSLEQNIINGVADYIIDRARQEAAYAFLENVKQKIFVDTRIQHLFPETYLRLQDSVNYFDLAIVKQAFIRDMDKLPVNIYEYITNKAKTDNFFADPKLLTGLVAVQKLYTDLTTDGTLETSLKELPDILNKIPFDSATSAKAIPIRDGLIFTSNLIGYLTEKNLIEVFVHNQQHVNLDALSKMLVAMALDNKTINSIDGIDLSNAYNTVKSVYTTYQTVSLQLKNLQASLEGKMPSSDFDGFKKFQVQSAIEIIYRAADVMQSGFPILDQLTYTNFKTPHLAYLSADTLKKVLDGFFMLKQGNYSQAAFLLSPMIVNAVFKGDSKDMIQKREYCNQLISIAGDVSAAKSAEDIQKLMAKYALPVASYRLKRASNYTVMVNAYAGLGYNYFDHSNESRLAISTPIGLEVSRKICKTQSLSLLLSLFDIGNVVGSRLWNPTSQDEQDVKLERVVSPGLYLSYGPFKKLPLSIYAGYAFNPNRFNVSLSFDLPLFAIYKSN